jgi:hypothetical protein
MYAQRGEFADEITVAACCLRLLLEGTQLATDLPHEVLHAGEVGIARGESALGAVLALAILQDAGRFLDDRATIFGAGVEHGVDLAL